MPTDLAFDATVRSYDANGWLKFSRSHISKACVNPYYGREIPGAEALGLDPDRVYYLLRSPEELAKAAENFGVVPILNKHIPLGDFDTMAEKDKKKYIVGSTGSDVGFFDPYLDADGAIWEADAIAGIETDTVREFSCSYRYVPIMTTGNYAGQKYDGIMTQIKANHVALVESGRAGADVLVADSELEKPKMKRTKLGNALIVALTTAFPSVKVAEDSELEKVLAPATRKDFKKSAAMPLILAMDAKIDEKQAAAVMDALVDVDKDDPEPSKKDAKDKKAKDAEEHPKGCMCADCKSARDEEPDDKDEKKKDAKDEEPASKKDMKGAMDALSADLKAQFREADQAKRDVREVVGDVVAMDSAAEIYTFALDQMKIDHEGVTDAKALRSIFNVAKGRQATATPVVAMDQASAVKRFPGLARISQG